MLYMSCISFSILSACTFDVYFLITFLCGWLLLCYTVGYLYYSVAALLIMMSIVLHRTWGITDLLFIGGGYFICIGGRDFEMGGGTFCFSVGMGRDLSRWG